MENMTRKVERMVRGNAKRRLWHRIVAIPAALIVFVTTYALILPAVAMERDTYCGIEAHQHGEECYAAQLACGYEDGQVLQSARTVTELACTAAAHQHTEECYDETGAVICGQADYLVHEHNADCYNAQGELVCPLPEVKAHTHDENCYVIETVNVCGQAENEGHVHTADCYTLVSHPELVCGQAESEGHVHTEACYTTYENTYLACGIEESAGHVHDENCYTVITAEDGTETTELTCTIPESLGHTHDESCYVTEAVTDLTCGVEENAGHTHTDACWANVEMLELTCGMEESAGHVHTEACFAEQQRLVCTQPEVIPHVHGDECYTVTGVAEDGTEIRELTCPMTVVESHEHTADCFATYEMPVEMIHEHTDLCYVQVLTCTLPEHEHTDACYVAPAESEVIEIADEPVVIPAGEVEIIQDETPCFAMPILVCGMSEHEHSTNCMDENMVYVCGIAPHTHSGACYAIPGLDGVSPILVCQQREHFHTEACYNEAGELTCGVEEHLHDVGCFALPEEAEDNSAAGANAADREQKTFENNEVLVTATYGPEAGLPENARLIAYKITAESDPERYAERLAQTAAKLNESELTAGQMVVYNIGFFDEHNCEIEPLAEVQVEVQFKDSEGFTVDGTAAVFHFDGESVELLDADSNVENNSATFSGNF